MIIDIRCNLETGEAKILSVQEITKKDVITIISSYFDVDMVDVTNIKKMKNEIVMTRQFIIYWLIYIFDTPSKEIKKILNYKENSSIITTSLNKLKDLLFDQKDEKYTRPYNNHSKIFAGFGIKINIIEK